MLATPQDVSKLGLLEGRYDDTYRVARSVEVSLHLPARIATLLRPGNWNKSVRETQ